MKKVFKVFLYSLSLALLGACESEDKEPVLPSEPVEPKLEIVQEIAGNNFSFSSVGNSTQTLKFTTNNKWKIDLVYAEGTDATTGKTPDWATVFNREGEAGEDIKVTIGAAENKTYESRSATFTLTSGGLTETYTIYQAQKDAVVITDPDAYNNMDCGEHTLSVEFGTNVGDCDYTINAKVDGSTVPWIVETDAPAAPNTRAMESHTLYFKMAANETFTTRTGSITITAKDNKEVKHQMNVIQVGMEKPVITINNADEFKNLAAKENVIDLNYTATNITKDGQLELIFDPEVSAPDWVTINTTSNQNTHCAAYRLTVKANDGSARFTKMVLRSTIDHEIQQKFTVSQNALEGLAISITNADEFNNPIEAKGKRSILKYESTLVTGDNDITVTASNASGTVNWVSVYSKTSKEVVLSFAENINMKEREATIKIALTSDSEKFAQIKLKQAGSEVLIIEADKSLQDALNREGLTSSEVKKLILQGKLSAADLALLKTMATNNVLEHLDMTDVDPTSEFDVCSQGQGGNYAKGQFMNCTKLIYAATPKDLAEIERNFFRYCTNLDEVVINEGTRIIHRHAFGNTKVTKAWFPSTIENVYGAIFDKITPANLVLHLKGTKPFQWRGIARDPEQPTTGSQVFDGEVVPGHVYVPAEAVSAYKSPNPDDVISSISEVKALIEGCKADKTKWTTVLGTVTNFMLNKNLTPKACFTWERNGATVEVEP